MQLFDAASLSDGAFEEILSFLRAGGVIGFPTDTAYGLGADPFSEPAVRRIFEIKGRPEGKPILLLVNSMAMAESVAIFSGAALALAKRFWPGPLTMILPARPSVPDLVTAGTGTVGIRWAKAPFAGKILQAMNQPITATSANRSGGPSAITAGEVRAQLEGRLELLVDGGALRERGGSTLLDMTGTPAKLLRPGPIPEAELGDVLKMKRRLLKWAALLIVIVPVSIGAYWVYLYQAVRSAAVRDEARTADVIVVLGAAQYNGRPSKILKARLDHVVELYTRGYARAVITTGGYGPDPNYSEAQVSTKYLSDNGVDAEYIITEQASLTTRDSISAAADMMKSKSWKTVVVVSDGFHLYRLKEMFDDEGIVAYASPPPAQ